MSNLIVTPAGEGLSAPIVTQTTTEEQQALTKIRARQLAGTQEAEKIVTRKYLKSVAKATRAAIKQEKSELWRAYREAAALLKTRHVSVGRELKEEISKINQAISVAYANHVENEVANGTAAIAVAVEDSRRMQ